MATLGGGGPDRVCCIVVCRNARPGANPTVGYHPFPADDAALRRLWIAFVGPANRERFRWRGKYICSEHFQAAEVIARDDGRKVLLENSIPTIFSVEEDDDEDEDPPKPDVTSQELMLDNDETARDAIPPDEPALESEEVIEEEIEVRSLFCRICLGKHQSGAMVPLSSRLREHRLVDMILAVTGLKMKAEGIVPNRICPDCVTKIDLAFNVREEFLQREKILRDMLAGGQLEQYYDTYAGIPAELPNQSYLSELIAGARVVEVKQDEKPSIEVLTMESIVPAPVAMVLPIEETIIEEIPISMEEEHLYVVDGEIISIEDDPMTVGLTEEVTEEEVEFEYSNVEGTYEETVTEQIEQPKPEEEKIGKPVGKVEPSMKEPPVQFEVIPETTKNQKPDQPDTSGSAELPYQVRPTLMDPKSCHICFTHLPSLPALAAHLSSHSGMIPYKCLRCSTDGTIQQIDSVAALNEHVGRHQFPFQCGFCDKRFSGENALFEHMRARHEDTSAPEAAEQPQPQVTTTEGFTCTTCGQQFAKRALYRHHMTRHEALEEERFKCQDCGRVFGSALLLRLHRKIHTESTPPQLNPYTCYVCSYSYENASALEEHMAEQHVGMLPFRCEECSTEEYPVVAKSLVLLNKHMRSHLYEFKCPKCPQRLATKRSLELHKYNLHSESNPDGYTCQLCGKFFQLRRAFRVHITKHRALERETFKCSHGDCGKAFSNSTLLRRHERIHTGEKPFECDKCGRRFNHKDNFLVHKRKHVNERGYSCTECDKSFFDAVSLRYHMGTHFPDNPRYRRPPREQNDPDKLYFCDYEGCDYSTRSGSSIHYHKGTHDKKFQCQFCLWRWPTNSALMQHIRHVHEGKKLPRRFECPYCPKKFPSRQKLEMHVDVHEDNRRYRCRYCDKSFIQSTNCIQHERIHTREKPFGCPYCPMMFASIAGLRRHEVARHAVETVDAGTPVAREEIVEHDDDLKVVVEMIGVDEPVLLENCDKEKPPTTSDDKIDHQEVDGYEIAEVPPENSAQETKPKSESM